MQNMAKFDFIKNTGGSMDFLNDNKLIFENSSDSIIILQDGLLKYINSNGFKLIGYERDEIINHHFKDFVYKDDLELVTKRYEKKVKGEPTPHLHAFRLVTKEGKINWFEIHGIEIMWKGRPANMTFCNNINKRKLAEESLSKREAQIAAVLNAIPDMLLQVKKDGIITSHRKPKFTIKKEYQDFVGMHIAEIIPEHLFDECIENINQAFEKKEVIIFEFPLKNDDTRTFFEARIVAFSDDEVLCLIRDITKRKFKEEILKKNQEDLKKEIIRLKSGIKGKNSFGEIIGRSPAMMKVFDEILKAASSSAHVVIYGESGTGKELVAKAIHDLSKRVSNKFVPVNCGAIPENLLESEFFGYKKGAFSGAVSDKNGFLDLASSGTLFMDEIGEIGLNMQVKLLRAIEGGGFIPIGGSQVVRPDLRIIGATNKNMLELVRKKEMREDFFFRINIIQINLPPLRERMEDLPLLIYHFLEKFGKGKTFPSIQKSAMRKLLLHDWPGNIRELQNVIQRYVTMNKIQMPEFKEKASSSGSIYESKDSNLKNAVSLFEKNHIIKVLEENRWHKGRTAEALGVHRKTLSRKINEFGI